MRVTLELQCAADAYEISAQGVFFIDARALFTSAFPDQWTELLTRPKASLLQNHSNGLQRRPVCSFAKFFLGYGFFGLNGSPWF